MKIIINASDVHSGGGMVMLNDLLDAAVKKHDIDYYIFVDGRYERKAYEAPNIRFIEVSKFKRIYFVDSQIKKLVSQGDIIINIGDLPAFLNHDCTVIQYLMNRYFIDDYTTRGLPLGVRLRLGFEKASFRFFLKNADTLFVQNNVMKDLLLQRGYSHDMVRVIPYKNIDLPYHEETGKIENSFLYVASGEAHKNHRNLVGAWKVLAREDLRPLLYLTIDAESELFEEITADISKHDLNIVIKPKLPRNELLKHYEIVDALIYPSFFECFGIPLIEAQNYNLPIIAAELDYVRDVVDPIESFDPNSPRSIARAIMRFIGTPDPKCPILSGDVFIEEMISYA